MNGLKECWRDVKIKCLHCFSHHTSPQQKIIRVCCQTFNKPTQIYTLLNSLCLHHQVYHPTPHPWYSFVIIKVLIMIILYAPHPLTNHITTLCFHRSERLSLNIWTIYNNFISTNKNPFRWAATPTSSRRPPPWPPNLVEESAERLPRIPTQVQASQV